MAKTVVITEDGDFNWLKILIENTVEKAYAGKVAAEVGIMAERLAKDFSAATTHITSIDELDEPEVPKRTRRSSKEVAEQDWQPQYCKDHPKYGAKRAPRTDCAECWKAYERLNPIKAEYYKRTHKGRDG